MARLHPNHLTALGIALTLAAAALVLDAQGIFRWFLAAALFGTGSLLDVLDGHWARRSGQSSPFGAFLDSTLDRVGESALLAAIAVVLARRADLWGVGFTVVAVAGSLLVSYVRARAEALGVSGKTGLGARPGRVLLLLLGLISEPWGGLRYAVFALAALAWLTVCQRVWGVRRQLVQDTTSSARDAP